MNRSLKPIVGAAMIAFLAFLLYFWTTGYLLPAKPVSPAEKGKAAAQAAKNGLFDRPGPPIYNPSAGMK